MLANIFVLVILSAWAVWAIVYLIRANREAVIHHQPRCVGCSQRCSHCSQCPR
ncbi:MAG: FeoB-associated Cys-rich membrane protein [Hallerella porci]|uniref:FeoB-associated Cys-rich membrane protein n=1 Tax=Hallerella TaxID=2815788 RepID=UPI000D6BE49E|nr:MULTISPECIES: FeoB-associated Cys-rich membrane protein [Hallerella]MCI5601226.1 FeoB-associated Cys-rich membrane protein [Hallerella sp.]MDY3922663.1 FeoB-associated Cys-rich membrane protein [Hallerella porci]